MFKKRNKERNREIRRQRNYANIKALNEKEGYSICLKTILGKFTREKKREMKRNATTFGAFKLKTFNLRAENQNALQTLYLFCSFSTFW